MRNFIRNYPISTIFVVFIWIICLIPIPETPLSDVSFIDKWTHIALYFVLSCVVGHEFFRANPDASVRQLVVWQFIAPALMGGLIEIVQATCTNGVRSGEWLDFAADAVGAAVGLLAGVVLLHIRRK